jgi:putative CocE/NonD family hydrolase
MTLRLSPHAKRALLSILLLAAIAQITAAQVRPEFGVRVAMRDGVRLAADLWFPKTDGRYPTILVRTPYQKDWTVPTQNFAELGAFYAKHGYVLMVQDVRGRGDSAGEFNFFFSDENDGYDTVEWIAKQSWSNGRVGMMGGSYLGTVQWLAARARPPHLVCIVPRVSAGRYFDEIPYQGGAFALEWALTWLNDTSDHTEQRFNLRGLDLENVFEHRPLLTSDLALGRKMRLFREFLQHSTLDEYWRRIQFVPADFRRIAIPALTITGWFDDDQSGSLFYWRGMRTYSSAREQQFLLLGPWTHAGSGSGGSQKLGGFAFPQSALYDPRAIHLAFFDRFLKGTGTWTFPRARVFLTGSNKWLDLPDYPPHNVVARPLYLHSMGRANTRAGDGLLQWSKPQDEAPDAFVYDPAKPVMPHASEGPGSDQGYLEDRQDMLVYTSKALRNPLTILGDITVTIYAATDGKDTDFTARLIDVQENGESLPLGPVVGIIRARYRLSYEHPSLLTPDKIEPYRIELFDIGHTFLPGHKIRLEISSSYAPGFDPNPNTGNPIPTDTSSRVAHQRIFHSADRASHIDMPVLQPD